MAPPMFDTVFGLAFDIEKDRGRPSGFKPAQSDLNAGKELFGDLRLNGFASLLRRGFTNRLIIVGGDEGRYKHDDPVINRARAIREMLILDQGINPKAVEVIPSSSNTGGNIAIIRSRGKGRFAVVSNHYHLPRAALDMSSAGMTAPLLPAEAFWLLEDRSRKRQIIERFGSGPFAERVAEEIQGIADKIAGTYAARTDVAPKRWWKFT